MSKASDQKKAELRADLFWKIYREGLDDDQRDDIEMYDTIVDAFTAGFMHGSGRETLEDLKKELEYADRR
jgi:hypothetical protein